MCSSFLLDMICIVLPQDFEIYSKVIPDPFQRGVLCTVDGCYFGQETVDGEIVD